MNDVGGSGRGTGLRAGKSSRNSDANFEYEDSEWDVGIGNLIIDLDADIEKSNEDSSSIGSNTTTTSTAAAGKATKSKTSSKSTADTTAGNNVNSSSGDKAAAAPRGDKSNKGSSSGNNANSSSPAKKSNGNNKSSAAAAGSSQGKTANSGGATSMHIPKSSEGALATSTTTTTAAASGVVNSSVVATTASVANSTTTLTTSTPALAATTTTLKSGKGALVTQKGAPSGTLLTGKSNSSSDSVGKANSNMSNSIDHSPGAGGIGDKGELKMKIKKLKSGTKNVGGAKHEIVRNDVAGGSSGKNSSSSEAKGKGDKMKADGPDKESNKSISNNDQDSSSVKNDSHSDKSSSKGATKRGSNTHKKVKGSLPNESASSSSNSKSNSTLANSGTLHNTSSSSKGKKDDSKLGTPTMPHSNSIANSHGKETSGSHNSSSVKASSSASILSSSLAVKISSGNNSFSNHNAADLSFPHSSTTTAASGGFGGASSTASTAGSNSSAFKSTLTNSPGNWASGSPVKNAGGDKGRLSPSTGSASDKSNPKTHSPSLGKKARALGQSDRSLSQEDSTPHAIAFNSGTNSGKSPTYRTSVTLSSASLNDLSTGSSGQGTTMPNTKPPIPSEVAFKTNRVSMPASTNTKHDVCVGTSVGTVTEPDCLGPCEPGTSVTLEGIVWHETESGILVVNVTWRGKTYVGTLMDCTKADWAPPRFCDSPTSDLEMRTPKNRAKRGRGQTATPVNDPVPTDSRQGNPKLRNGVKGRRGSSTNSGFATPVSPLKGDSWQKRKTRGSEIEEEVKTAKRAKVLDIKNGAAAKERQSASPAPTSGENSLIECPEPNCSKKYKHINGLKYHQSHAHSNSTVLLEDSDSNMSSASGTVAEGKGGGNNADMVDGHDADIMEVDMVSTTDGENTSSAPTTPAKRSKELSDKVYDINADLDLKDDTSYPAKMRVLKVTATSASAGKEGDKDGNTRVPILSVPVYSVSAQSRQDDKDGAKGNVIKGAATWQPNVITSSSSPVALAVPVINSSSKDGKSKDQKDRSSDSSQSKKNKHKKKSKDKDRERDRDSQKGSNGVGELPGNKSPMQSGLSGKSRDSLDKRSSSLEELRAEKEVHHGSPQLPPSGKPTAEVQPMTEVSHADPRSPAYSDISDANDSGPENDLNLSKKDTVPMSGIADLAAAGKKDGVVGIPPGHGISPFFPSFYSPFIDPNKSGDGRDAEVGPDGKPKPKPHLPHHLHLAPTGPTGSPEGRRSPLRESIPGKFPPHYFGPHGPYMGYYDYPPGAAAPPQQFPDGNYATGARKMDDKDKSKPDKSDSHALITHIKQEPGAEKERGKEEKEVHHHHHHHDKPEREGNHLLEKRPLGLLPNQHIIPCNKHAASKDAKRAAAERERELREREEREAKRNEKNKEESDKERDIRHSEGAKPTMETTGPPPPPTAGSYERIPYHAYLPGGPFGYVDHGLYRQMMGPPFPGYHPSPAPRFPHLGGGLMPEDLSRPGGPPGGPKALDVLSQHAAQYYASASHKIHELQERALKSPNPQINSGVVGTLPGAPGSPSGIPERGGRGSIVGGTPGTGPSSAPSSGLKPADLSKDMKPMIVPGHSPESRSPPTQHHVHSHTHHHTHVGIGYPIIPTVPPQYSPHYGVIPSPAPPPAVAASVITPFPPPKST